MSGVEVRYCLEDMDRLFIRRFIKTSYWGAGRNDHGIERALRNSSCVGLFDATSQVAFARAVSDRSYIAYVSDLFVIDAYRGRGFGHRVFAALVAHPDLSEVDKWMLATRDAHAFYSKMGFTEVDQGRYLTARRDALRL